MKTFSLILQDLSQEWRSDRVTQFIGRDASGGFGILAGHETFVTCLQPGLARFLTGEGSWLHLAQPGSVVLFAGNTLCLSTTQFVLGDREDELLAEIDAAWRDEAKAMRTAKRSIVQVEQALTRRLWEMNRRSPVP